MNRLMNYARNDQHDANEWKLAAQSQNDLYDINLRLLPEKENYEIFDYLKIIVVAI